MTSIGTFVIFFHDLSLPLDLICCHTACCAVSNPCCSLSFAPEDQSGRVLPQAPLSPSPMLPRFPPSVCCGCSNSLLSNIVICVGCIAILGPCKIGVVLCTVSFRVDDWFEDFIILVIRFETMCPTVLKVLEVESTLHWSVGVCWFLAGRKLWVGGG